MIISPNIIVWEIVVPLMEEGENTQECAVTNEKCRIIERLMYKSSGSSPPSSSSGNAVVATTTKARGKKKKVLGPGHFVGSGGSRPSTKKQSIPDVWDSMVSNIREGVDQVPVHQQNSGIRMPEIHQGIANSSMPIPLNTIMKAWNNVPKLHQYQPTDLQVIYHRRTGEVETIKPSEHNKRFELDADEAIKYNKSSEIEITNGNSSFPQLSYAIKQTNDTTPLISPHSALPPSKEGCSTPININSTPTKATSLPPLQNNWIVRDDKHFAKECQTEIFTKSESCQAYIPGRCEESQATVATRTESCQAYFPGTCTESQTEPMSLHPNENDHSHTNHCDRESQTLVEPSSSPKHYYLSKNFSQYQHHASQTEPINQLNEKSSQFTCASAQTTKTELISRAVETEKSTFSIAIVQAAIKIPSNDVDSQTEIDMETPKICMTCEFNQLQMDELEEKVDELNRNLKMKETELSSAQKKCFTTATELQSFKVVSTDSSTNTEGCDIQVTVLPPAQRQMLTEESQKLILLQEENQKLKAANETLKTQIHSFQHGLSRLKTAIEKPIAEDSGISEEAIQEVLHKADDLIMNCSNSQSRARKINDHLSVLNSCVSVANGILQNKPK